MVWYQPCKVEFCMTLIVSVYYDTMLILFQRARVILATAYLREADYFYKILTIVLALSKGRS